MLTMIAPMKEEYLARDPNVCTAWDSTSPGVIENRVNEAISGKNKSSANNLKSKDIATAIAPAAIPPMKKDFDDIMAVKYDFACRLSLVRLILSFFPDPRVFLLCMGTFLGPI